MAVKAIRIKYNRSAKGKATRKRYMQSKKGKFARAKANKKYNQKHRKDKSNHYKKYLQTKKGKFANCKKSAKRRNNLDFIPLFDNPFDDLELIEWHHITDIYVVAIPKDLHRQYLGISHRNNTIEIVKQIYGGG